MNRSTYLSISAAFGILLALSSTPATAGTADDFSQNASLNAKANYTSGFTPTNTVDVRITSSTQNLTMSSSLAMESLNITNGSVHTLSDSSTIDNVTLTLGNSAGFTNAFSLVSNDLIYLAGGSTLVINRVNSSGRSLAVALANSGNFNVGANSTLRIDSIISGAGLGLTLSNSGTVIFGGANTYTGDTQILAGDLRFDVGGTSNSSTIRLGDTSGSNSATLSLGLGNGNNVGSALEVRSGSSGTKVLRSLGTSGTNTYSGIITMNAALTLESSSGGTLLLQGGSVDVKTNVLTVDTQSAQNGSNTSGGQGAVTINELLGSSLVTGGSLVKDGGNTLILQGTTNTYTGTSASALNANGTQIRDGVLGIFGDQSLGLAPTAAANNIFFMASALTTPSNTQTLQDTSGNVTLAATRNISIASGVTARLDSNGNIFTIGGVINGSGNLNKISAGTLVLNGNNTFTGTTTVSAGTLNAAANGALGSTSGITVNNGGTLLLSNSAATNRISNSAPIVLGSATGSGTPTFGRQGPGVVSEGTGAHRNGATLTNTPSTVGLGALSLASNSTFDFNLNGAGGVGTFTFAGFNPSTFVLNVINYSSSATATSSGTDGVDDRLIFAGTPPLNTSITFNGAPSTFLALDPGFYEVIPLAPVPEPSTWVAAALAAAVIGYQLSVVRRRRLVRK